MSNQFLGKNFRYNTMYTMNAQFRPSPLQMRQRPAGMNLTVNNFNAPSIGGGFGFSPMPMFGFGFGGFNPLASMPNWYGATLGVMDGLTGMLNSTAFAPGGLFNPTKTTETKETSPADQKEKDAQEIAQLEQLLKGKISKGTVIKKDGMFYCQDKDNNLVGPKSFNQMIEHFSDTEAAGPTEKKEQPEQPQEPEVPDEKKKAEEEAAAKKKAAEADEAYLDGTGTSPITKDALNDELKNKGIKSVSDAVNKTSITGKSSISSTTNSQGFPESITVDGHQYQFKGLSDNGDPLYKSVRQKEGSFYFVGDTYRLRISDKDKQLVLIQVDDKTENGAGSADRTKTEPDDWNNAG